MEIFGTGITRIKQLCEEGLKQPDFEVSENTIKIILLVFEKNLNLTEDERKVDNVKVLIQESQSYLLDLFALFR